jgi:hypothetical protein
MGGLVTCVARGIFASSQASRLRRGSMAELTRKARGNGPRSVSGCKTHWENA